MNIVTKKGDRGITSLCGGRRVKKDHIRVEVCGMLDELSSFLGLSKSLVNNNEMKKIIGSIQKDLFIIGAEIATESKLIKHLKKRIDNDSIRSLDGIIENLERKRKSKKRCFVMPGSTVISSILDIARTITRRVERKTVALKRRKMLNNPSLFTYLNRLSDLLYLLARSCERKSYQFKRR
ncbi:MAG: cob(I)yrinic acid a,c-diamide adenosyltransferase [Candidatus Omnitrophota bacterium]|nr:MAG: cob(I)yrinic acid a,c-diamide adenosyltransferase [Candidatus Omnitrophota bacterium]